MPLNAPVEVITASTVTATGQSATFNRAGKDLYVEVDTTAISGTSPSITFGIQFSHDGTTWFSSPCAASFAATIATGNQETLVPSMAEFWRLTWTVTGTTPSVTFNVFQSDTVPGRLP